MYHSELQHIGISDLGVSGKYSDFSLECQGIKFPVHKAILYIYSPVLADICDALPQDSGPNVIQVTGFDPSTLKKMIDFMYHGPYPRFENLQADTKTVSECDMDYQYVVPDHNEGPAEMKLCEDDPMFKLLRPHFLAHSIAEHYRVEVLKEHSQSEISTHLGISWSADGFFPALKFVLESSPDEKLHDIMISSLIEHSDELSTRDDFAIFQMPHHFAIKLLRGMAGHINWLEKCLKLEKEQNYELEVDIEKMRDRVPNAALNIPKCGQCSVEFHA